MRRKTRSPLGALWMPCARLALKFGSIRTSLERVAFNARFEFRPSVRKFPRHDLDRPDGDFAIKELRTLGLQDDRP